MISGFQKESHDLPNISLIDLSIFEISPLEILFSDVKGGQGKRKSLYHFSPSQLNITVTELTRNFLNRGF